LGSRADGVWGEGLPTGQGLGRRLCLLPRKRWIFNLKMAFVVHFKFLMHYFRAPVHEAAGLGDGCIIPGKFLKLAKLCILAHCTAPAPQMLGEQSPTCSPFSDSPEHRCE